MKTNQSKWLRIEQLDQLFQNVRAVRIAVPRPGWIKETRGALGMTAAQLARRLGISQPSLAGLERSEAEGSITITSLRKVAQALECDLVYALVPKTSLKSILERQLRLKARREVAFIAHTMALEAQSVAPNRTEAHANELFSKMKMDLPKNLWE